MAANPQTALSGLARALIQHGRLSEADAAACTKSAANVPNGFILELAQRKLLTTKAVAWFAAETFGYPLLDISSVDRASIPRDAIDRKLMAKHQVVALGKRQNRLTVATADPSNMRALDEIRFQTGMQVDLIVVEADRLARLAETLSESTEDTLKDLTGEEFDMDLLQDQEATEQASEDASAEVDDAPVVKFIQKVLIDAINEGASDIHFEPYEKYYRIRVRTDGILREIAQPPLILKEKIAARIKVISRLDISEKRIPQDGRMKLVLSKNKSIDFRVSSLPTLHGEKIVMRILDASSAMLGVDALGYELEQKKVLLDAIERPYGMILVTGPTGSGKTVSLYTCLNILNKPGVNISTAEDPAEINLAGINQVNVNDKAGLTFAASLRAFLRQDPDVIMVGEIRDLETAEISIKAAQTGHLVLSTLHTNDAPTTLERLRNMGVAPFNIASSVILITAQRLARRLCTCKQPVDIPVEALLDAGFSGEDLDGSWRPYGPVGCERCKGSGYKGRLGIYQVMPISAEIAHIIMTNGNSMDIAAQAQREGVRDLRQSGLLKVKQGATSLEEVLATTNE
ncbi:type IV-A pilus assembly ATPase PilB [Aromatoleum petrolei]|uniref:Type IV-A pilus assembly ATPase PilB n=1 Tax=Aromatoleum petrolei TaxID=76116 RepID=A0ABX1MT35_9RHOO|nr:type IV-A pilus assembly ATPase PilB [Aromatoleum petrolei]NMF90400.1 type IV-A pilus assembly ATPase PilB [Aromatoleum petrolei]QTQ35706.1 Type IV fimbrial assembly protein [Aromatoleum petrolei]